MSQHYNMFSKSTPQISNPFIEFSDGEQAYIFERLKQDLVSGQLILTNQQEKTWTFYLSQGDLLYATGGTHPVRRWNRNLAAVTDVSQLSTHISEVPSLLAGPAAESIGTCWEYQLICLWVEQEKITHQQASRLISLNLIELFFDLLQSRWLSYQLIPAPSLPMGLVQVNEMFVIATAEKLWQSWQSAQLTNILPSKTPVIRQPEQLRQQIKAKNYLILSQLLDGQSTLWDIAIRMKRDIVVATLALLPYIKFGAVELIDSSDQAWPADENSINPSSRPSMARKPLIACVDDSPLICHLMERTLTKASYEFVSINDPLQAVSTLSDCQPDMIFLDLIMPTVDGYEVVHWLRDLDCFRQTPIVILTSNNTVIDRIRAKMAGSSDFLSKPVDAAAVLAMVDKHLPSAMKSRSAAGRRY